MVKASWPGIIDEQIFQDAQHLLSEATDKERTRLGKSEKRVFLLTGILNCGETGLPLVGQAGHSSNGSVHRYYHYVRKPKDLKVIRPRLSADELEEKVFAELEIALKTQGYFDELAAILAKQSEVNNKGNAAEFQRVQQELKDVNLRISAIWTNQSRMQLGEEALKLASDELNRLAIQKQDLEKYQRQLGEHRSSPEIFREKANFIEAQVKWCQVSGSCAIQA
jgi:site-specific DNA recombinase